jgi:hypothetical protein
MILFLLTPMPPKAKSRKVPKPTVLRDFFSSLDDPTREMLLLALNMEADAGLTQKTKQDQLEAKLMHRAR